MKNLFTIIFFASIMALASCGGDTKTADTKKTDTAAVAKTPETLAKLNAQLLADPNNADLYHQRAKYYYQTKDYESGLADMARVMKIDSSKADYFLTLSDLYFVTNHSGNAKAALEKCLQLDNKNVDAMLKLAELYLYVQQHDKSIEYINMALKVNQYNAKAYYMKGMNYIDMKDTAKAISSMQTTVEQDQEYYRAYMQLGILCAAKKSSLAVQYYKNALRIQPRSTEAWYDLGKYYQDVQDWNNALETYTTLLKIDANNKNAHFNLGVIHLVNLKVYDIALNHFNDALKIDPKYVEAYYGRGVCYQTLGDVKKAAADFQTCLTIDPQYQPAQIGLKQLNGGK